MGSYAVSCYDVLRLYYYFCLLCWFIISVLLQFVYGVAFLLYYIVCKNHQLLHSCSSYNNYCHYKHSCYSTVHQVQKYMFFSVKIFQKYMVVIVEDFLILLPPTSTSTAIYFYNIKYFNYISRSCYLVGCSECSCITSSACYSPSTTMLLVYLHQLLLCQSLYILVCQTWFALITSICTSNVILPGFFLYSFTATFLLLA